METTVCVEDKSVFAKLEGGIGRLTLNRPKALNALTTDMCHLMSETLAGWATDDGVQAVMLDHADGTRGFCAGGDIRAVAQSGRGDGIAARAFFRAEYLLNSQIKAFPKPFISLMDGIVMGGGVGLSVHGTYRVCSENTLFAMPETGIGLFPDVGGGWFLPRLEGEVGVWLALTGQRLMGADVKAAGIATHYVSAADIPSLKRDIVSGDESIDAVLRRYDRAVAPPSYGEHLEAINRIFGKSSLPDICIALKLEDSDWAQHQGEVMATRSPFSMAVALRQLREGRQMTRFEEVMTMEYRIAARLCQSHDFLEGVRAILEDKDHSPQWVPRAIGGVTAASLDAVFAPLAHELYD